jgi:hypothetical protein
MDCAIRRRDGTRKSREIKHDLVAGPRKCLPWTATLRHVTAIPSRGEDGQVMSPWCAIGREDAEGENGNEKITMKGRRIKRRETEEGEETQGHVIPPLQSWPRVRETVPAQDPCA